ncbi:MAG: hypothetical protein IKF38_01950 [Clostridia bacterium]|nr:hypothetical protein [Clostridia bacterium]
MIEGEIADKGGNLTWGEIEENVPPVVSRVEITPTTLDIEKGGTGSIEVKCYNSSNNLIPIRKLGNISISKRNGSENITLNQNATNQAEITVNESEEIGEYTIEITITANGTSIYTEITINVKPKETIVGQFVEYNVGYIDISTNASDEPNNFEFTPLNGWRILEIPEQTKQADGSYKTTTVGETTYYVKIISTGVPGGLYYSTTKTNNSWWGDSGLNKTKVVNGLSTPSKFEIIVFNAKNVAEANNASYKNQGYYTQIKHYTSSSPTVINTDGKTAAELFKLSNVAAEVDTLTLEELNIVLNNANVGTNITTRATNSRETLNTTNDPKSLFNLRGLGKYSYETDTKNWAYWVANPVPITNYYDSVDFMADGSYILYTQDTIKGLRPVIALSSNVYIEKNKSTGRWEIKNITNP